MNPDNFQDRQAAEKMYMFAGKLWPICRSLTGNGVRQTLALMKTLLPQLQIHEVPSGTQCFDWTVPDEWNVNEAYLLGPDGKTVVDFKNNNLHVMGYSEPIDQTFTLEELQPHLFSLEGQPTAIPYVTSYYKRNWGFCLSHNLLRTLKPGRYRAIIRSELKKGHLTYADLVLPGETEEEIFFSTYVCHPSMANNELSGPVVATALAEWLSQRVARKFTYRFYFGPETIGAIVYLSKHLAHLKSKVKAGYVLTCVGDDRNISFLSSRNGNTLADRLTLHVLHATVGKFIKYPFLDRGSDERQYCSPGADLPVVSIMRTKYGMYPEYHTSLDDLNLISPGGLGGTLAILKACIQALEMNETYVLNSPCEPQLGRRGLYPNTSVKGVYSDIKNLMNLLAYCDGENDLLTISEIIGIDIFQTGEMIEKLYAANVIRKNIPNN